MYLMVLLCGALAWTPAFGRAWPAKPVRIVVAGAPGASLDIPVRAVGEKLKDRLDQPIVVENRVAAGGTLAADTVARGSRPWGTMASRRWKSFPSTTGGSAIRTRS